jgi:hypothetical protein
VTTIAGGAFVNFTGNFLLAPWQDQARIGEQSHGTSADTLDRLETRSS